MPPRSQKGWYSRGYIPHLDVAGKIQAVTFRLADSVPKQVIERWKQELCRLSEDKAKRELGKRIAVYEDAGHGDCLLKDPANAKIVEDALLHFDGGRYELHEWVIMPNHVHAMFKPTSDRLDRIIKSWKSFTSRMINELTDRSGSLWAREYHDRYIRGESHYIRAKNYVRLNPVKACLCKNPEDWPCSSAQKERRSSDRHRQE